MSKPMHIAVNLPFTPIAREIMRGIRGYFPVEPDWTFEIRSQQDASTRRWLKAECDAVISYGGTRTWHRVLSRLGLPCVVITSDLMCAEIVQMVGEDNIGIGRMVGDDFLARRFQNFGVIPGGHRSYGPDRTLGFTQTIERAGLVVHRFVPPTRPGAGLHMAALRHWIKQLPKPVGVFAVNDSQGTLVLEACRRQSISVPDDVAVVGVGNDVQVCNLCTPSLSSVSISYEETGLRAAELLHRLIEGKSVPALPMLLPARGIVTRRSSETTAVNDPVVTQAFNYIVDHACDPIGVEDVARHVGYSYRRLHERFEQASGRLLHEEIRRVQLNRARLLLTETDMPIHKVAYACGWRTGKQIDRIFKQHEGMTPMEYRSCFRTD